MHRGMIGALAFVITLTLTSASAQEQAPSATEGWVQLPADGATRTSAFALVKNPGMYDVYLVSASSEVAAKVEFRHGSDDETVGELTVPAYGRLSMAPDGAHIELVDLKRPLEEDESVAITLTTDGNIEIHVTAVVRKE